MDAANRLHRSLRHVPSHKGINPFTRQPCEFNAPASTAQITFDGARVGAIEWAMDGSPLLLVHADDEWMDYVASVAEGVAFLFGARFVRIRDEG
jgi:hypothetical protein